MGDKWHYPRFSLFSRHELNIRGEYSFRSRQYLRTLRTSRDRSSSSRADPLQVRKQARKIEPGGEAKPEFSQHFTEVLLARLHIPVAGVADPARRGAGGSVVSEKPCRTPDHASTTSSLPSRAYVLDATQRTGTRARQAVEMPVLNDGPDYFVYGYEFARFAELIVGRRHEVAADAERSGHRDVKAVAERQPATRERVRAIGHHAHHRQGGMSDREALLDGDAVPGIRVIRGPHLGAP